MKKTYTILYLIMLCAFWLLTSEMGGQILAPKTIIHGQILCPDSIPLENVYLINYTTVRAYATDKNGKFSIQVHATDSLKVHHVSFASIILKPKAEKQIIILEYRDNALSEIVVKYNDRELQNLDKNFELMMMQLSKEHYYNFKPAGVSVNAYAPQKEFSGIAEVNFFDLFNYVRKRRKNK